MERDKNVTNETQQAIIDRIRELCKQNNISPSELATRCGVSRSNIRDILNGSIKKSSVLSIKIICDGLDIQIEEFFASDIFRNLGPEIK